MKAYNSGDMIRDRYQVISLLGEGGLGCVYLCQDSETTNHVAAKVIKPETSIDLWEVVEALNQEASILSQLRHQNIVRLYEFIDDYYDPMFIMEYVNGYTVCDAALGGGYEYESFLDCAMQALEGLAAAHRKGLLHLDIKPENIMLTYSDEGRPQIKLLDFGISKLLTDACVPEEGSYMVGSIYFVAPEQLTRKSLSAATDLYSLGLVFYNMLAWASAYHMNDAEELVRTKIQQDAPDIRHYRPDLSDDFAQWLHTLIQRDPKKRPQSCQEAIKNLTSICIKQSRPPEPPQDPGPTKLGRRVSQSLKDLLEKGGFDF